MKACVFDVESLGLYGIGFQFGAVVVDLLTDKIEEEYYYGASVYEAVAWHNMHGIDFHPKDAQWVQENVPEPKVPLTLNEVWQSAWEVLWLMKERQVPIFADCQHPVESGFLRHLNSRFFDPEVRREMAFSRVGYPIHEIATMRMASGFDPLAATQRLPEHLPAHQPLNDAKHSARELGEAHRILLSGQQARLAMVSNG